MNTTVSTLFWVSGLLAVVIGSLVWLTNRVSQNEGKPSAKQLLENDAVLVGTVVPPDPPIFQYQPPPVPGRAFPDGFKATQKHDPLLGGNGLAIDSNSQRLCLWKFNPLGKTRYRIFNFGDLISVEMFERGRSITKTSRTSQIGNAVLGGLVLGPIGAVVGALTSKQVTTNTKTSAELLITVTDLNEPMHRLSFSRPDKAREWLARLNTVIRLAESEPQLLGGGQ